MPQTKLFDIMRKKSWQKHLESAEHAFSMAELELQKAKNEVLIHIGCSEQELTEFDVQHTDDGMVYISLSADYTDGDTAYDHIPIEEVYEMTREELLKKLHLL